MSNRLDAFSGIIPALMTPFDRNGDFAPSCSSQMVDFLINMGVTGFYLTGSNGHGPFMEPEERMRVVETIAAQVNGRVPVVAHIAHVSAKHSCRMAKHAASCGCLAVSAVPSYYGKLTPEEMQTYYGEIAAASPLPLIVYAQTNNYAPSVAMFERLRTIPNVEGVKFTGADHYMMGRIKAHLGPDFKVYSGSDEMLLSGQIMGADGAIGGTYNVIPDPYLRALSAFWQGEVRTAQRYMLAANAILELMFRYNLSAAMRAGLGMMGVDAGFNPSPIGTLDRAQTEALRRDLAALRAELGVEDIALLNAAAGIG